MTSSCSRKSLHFPKADPTGKAPSRSRARDGPTNEGEQGNNSEPDSGDQPDVSDGITLDNSFSFEVGGGTADIVQSIQTKTQSSVPGVNIPPTNKMIGLDKSRIAGFNVVSPTFTFTITQVFETLTLGYLKNLRYLVGTVAGYEWLGFRVRELLLFGVSGKYKAGSTSSPLGSWTCSFKYGAEQNVKGVTVGSITPFDKNGWDYVWYGYQDQYDATSGLTVPTPIYASVEQVYYYTDHSRLGINLNANSGTTP